MSYVPVASSVEEGEGSSVGNSASYFSCFSSIFSRLKASFSNVSNRVTSCCPSFDPKSQTGRVLIAILASYLVASLVVPPRGYYEPSDLALLRIGSVSMDYVQCVACGYLHELRRLVVPIFLHLSPIHLLLNSLFIFSAGPEPERILGPKKFLLLILLSGLFANLLQAAVGTQLAVGASTSCFGILGWDCMRTYSSWPRMSDMERLSNKLRLRNIAIYCLVWELMNWDSIAHWGHFGGLVGGVCLEGIWSEPNSPRDRKIKITSQIVYFATILASAGILFTPVLLNFQFFRKVCWELQEVYV